MKGISGEDGDTLQDGENTTCVNIQPQDGAQRQYLLNVNNRCFHDNYVTVRVTVPSYTDCYALESLFVTEDADSDCGKRSIKVKRCKITEFFAVGGNRVVCALRCKCADVADSCDIQVYTKPMGDIRICEVSVQT